MTTRRRGPRRRESDAESSQDLPLLRSAGAETPEVRKRWRDLVRDGYDTVSLAYRDDEGRSNSTTEEHTDQYRAWVDELARMVEPGSRVLDLGCGAGLPTTRELVTRGFSAVGLDISPVQIERARRLVPGADFICADMATWDAEPSSFDAVLAFYSLIHLPVPDQRELLPRIRRWLRQDGVLLAIVGKDSWTGIEDYLGAPMFWDHVDSATYLQWFHDVGLIPVWNRHIPEGATGHVLVLARAV